MFVIVAQRFIKKDLLEIFAKWWKLLICKRKYFLHLCTKHFWYWLEVQKRMTGSFYKLATKCQRRRLPSLSHHYCRRGRTLYRLLRSSSFLALCQNQISDWSTILFVANNSKHPFNSESIFCMKPLITHLILQSREIVVYLTFCI